MLDTCWYGGRQKPLRSQRPGSQVMLFFIHGSPSSCGAITYVTGNPGKHFTWLWMNTISASGREGGQERWLASGSSVTEQAV
ncbi:hypothetical protein EWB00_000040 [Schistosoma japonicum]|uniref:Uncharacterized protein n=1 Tax=Schistosoma japonicum TaxID=6182 RepID=A0A4Z2CKE0_SCHJA|nr:hypothetical protein EWB00_000040 [Schistosoma japonicum]